MSEEILKLFVRSEVWETFRHGLQQQAQAMKAYLCKHVQGKSLVAQKGNRRGPKGKALRTLWGLILYCGPDLLLPWFKNDKM